MAQYLDLTHFLNYKVIKKKEEAYLILMDLPAVLDENLNEYGPFKAKDLVTLPSSIGDILVKRGAAKRVNIFKRISHESGVFGK